MVQSDVDGLMTLSAIEGLPALARNGVLSYIGDFSETRIMNSLISMSGLGQGPGNPVCSAVILVPELVRDKLRRGIQYFKIV